MPEQRTPRNWPKILLGAFILVWLSLGLWICFKSLFASGTDESIQYAAFAAAKNRWATEADFEKYRIEHFYYPPLYFLAFAPFFPDDPALADKFPPLVFDRNYEYHSDLIMIDRGYAAGIPPILLRLYRSAKVFSLLLGLAVILCLVAVVRRLFPGRDQWWLALGGAVPCLWLPQFLYYHTLCNNDALLNALAAATYLSFTAAVLAAERGSQAAFRRWSLAAAAGTGLAFLTKDSAIVLAPVTLALAMVPLLDEAAPRALRLKRAGRLLLAMTAVALVAGGWWVVYRGLQGDWTGMAAHRLGHPWALSRGDLASMFDYLWMTVNLFDIVQSYFALFTGALIGIPDTVFALYLVLPLIILAWGAGFLFRSLRRRKTPGAAGEPGRLRKLIWATFAVSFIFNFAMILLNRLFVFAPYGRLMYPTLVPAHALFALLLLRWSGGRRRRQAVLAVALSFYFISLFAWTFRYRLALAVDPPVEKVITLSPPSESEELKHAKMEDSVWEHRVSQFLKLPEGTLTAMRVLIYRFPRIPEFGARIEGELLIRDRLGELTAVRLRRVALENTDTAQRWTDLPLEKPFAVRSNSQAILTLRATPPYFPTLYFTLYGVTPAGMSDLAPQAYIDDSPQDISVCVAAVYHVPGPGPPP